MSTPDLSAFNFSFDPTLDTWAVSDKPAELDSSEIFLPNVEGRTEFLAPDPDRVPVIENSVRTDDPTYAARPAEERTRELLSQMRPHRATLLGILAACETPMATSAMKEAVERISGRKFSVYTPSNFCTMLEVAGGLARVTDAGEPYTDEVRAPEMVEVDENGNVVSSESEDTADDNTNLYGNVAPPEPQGEEQIDENWSDGVTSQDLQIGMQ